MGRITGIAAVALAVLLAGCGNRGGSLFGFTPEGVPNQAVLQAQVDTVGATLTASALVFVQAPTNRIRVYDDINNAGYQPTGDFEVQPSRTFSTGWAVYRVTLPTYDPAATHVLLARGSRDGAENVLSPLSNAATIPAGTAATLLAGRDTLPLFPRAPVPSPDAAPSVKIDSVVFHVAAVANAQRIYLEITLRGVTNYLAVFERQSNGSFLRTLVLENVPPRLNQTYLWHVDEYDTQFRLVAATTVNGSFVVGLPKVPNAPFVWPTAVGQYVFKPWIIPATVGPAQTR
jgi:hypothetical protein